MVNSGPKNIFVVALANFQFSNFHEQLLDNPGTCLWSTFFIVCCTCVRLFYVLTQFLITKSEMELLLKEIERAV